MSDAGQPSGHHGLEVPKRGKERPDLSSVVEMRGTHRSGREHTPWRVLAGLERELVGNISTLCEYHRNIHSKGQYHSPGVLIPA